jgi:class 3 adenylate cyclase
MEAPLASQAWLESPIGERWPVPTSCSVGRSLSNQVVLSDIKVSRRHALIHTQGVAEFWLVDLGSSNGTYLNEHRVSQPTRLEDRDLIAIGDFVLVFRHPQAVDTSRTETITELTMQEIKVVDCWLLVADMVASTQLSKELSPEELSVITGTWLAQCKELIERHKGSINKFLGDGFLAYWPGSEPVAAAVAQALREFQQLQAKSHPCFRIVVHYGQVATGGAATLGEESLLGKEVNLAFRLERLASRLGLPRVMTQPAKARLPPALSTTQAGAHALPGFDQPQLIYTF